MIEIKTINDKKELKEVFNFLSKTFYYDAKEYHETYYAMGDRYNEMCQQLELDKDFLLYIEENNKIIAALTGKGLDQKNKKITMGVMAVDKEYRRKGYGKYLIQEFEKRCIQKGITHIELGSRIKACSLYVSLGYKPSLIVQVYDFSTTNDIKKANSMNLEVISECQGGCYGYVLFKVDEINKEYVEHFNSTVENSYAQYFFEKELMR